MCVCYLFQRRNPRFEKMTLSILRHKNIYGYEDETHSKRKKKNFSTYYATIFTVFIFFYWVCILLIICESQDKFPSLCDIQYRCFKILNSQSVLLNTSNTEHYTCFPSQSDINILLVNRPIKLPFWSPFVDVRFPSLFSPFLWF